MGTNEIDDRPTAVTQASVGAAAWRQVVHAQLVARPAHADWYAITGEVMDTLRAMASLAGVLVGQIGNYGEGRVLRDDAGADPVERLAYACSWAARLQHELDRAEQAADYLLSEVGHIAVEVDR